MGRITGLATGMDMDQVIKESMRPYRIKIDKVKQQSDVVEIRQKLYRDVITDCRGFYDKYFDVASPDSLLLSKNYSNVNFESKDSTVATATGTASSVKDNYEIKVDSLAKPSTMELSLASLGGEKDIQFEYNGKKVAFSVDGIKDDKELAKKLSKELDSLGLKATFSDFTNSVTIETKETGTKIGTEDNKFSVSVGTIIPASDPDKEPTFNVVNDLGSSKDGENLKATIKNSKGTITYGDGTGGTVVSGKNSIVLDGVQFSITDVGETKIIGKSDVTEVKDRIVNFVNDYNKLMESLNKQILDKPNKGYEPLTEEQKKELSEEEIKAWNKKVEQGKLSRDGDVTRIVNSMKSAMSSLVSGTGLTLESIGIKPVPDYSGTKNGTFTIDAEKLTSALENNMDEIMTLFTQSAPTDATGSDKFNQQGIMQRLKTTLYDEVVTVTSPLIQKAGVEGSASFKNNTLTKQMETYSKKMQDMEKDFLRREQALYSKWAIVEKTMNSYNSQQSYLMSQLG